MILLRSKSSLDKNERDSPQRNEGAELSLEESYGQRCNRKYARARGETLCVLSDFVGKLIADNRFLLRSKSPLDKKYNRNADDAD